MSWTNLRGTKSDKPREKGRIEFMESLNLSHVQLEKKKILCGSFTFFAKDRLYKGILKDCRLICASESVQF